MTLRNITVAYVRCAELRKKSEADCVTNSVRRVALFEMKVECVVIAILCILCSSVVAFQGHNRRINVSKSSLSMKKVRSDSNKGFNLPKVATKLKAKFLPAILGASLMISSTGAPDVVNAARSGGRSGGSSFRMPASSGRSSSAMRGSARGYSGGGYSRGYGGGMSVMPMPMYSPFGYGGFGISPFGFMPINLNVLVLGFIAYTVFNALSNRVGGQDFSDDGGTVSSLGSGATVVKLQISMSSNWAEEGNIMQTLTSLAERNSAMTNRNDLARLLSESSMALLRRVNDWDSAAYEGERFLMSPAKAEPYFQKMAVGERSKFEKEMTGADSRAMIKNSNDMSASQPTEMVVSLVVALRGQSSGYVSSVRSLAEVKACLQGLAADALIDEGDNVMAVEVLWTPSEPGTCISPREIVEDYPELIKF